MPNPAAPSDEGADQLPSGVREMMKPDAAVADTKKPALICVMNTMPLACLSAAICGSRTLGSA